MRASPNRRGTHRRFSSEGSALVERWTVVDGAEVFYRESPPVDGRPVEGPVVVHLHGFGMSGAYLAPTASRLATDHHTFVPDLPGFGRSGRARDPLDIPDLADQTAAFLDDRGIGSATLLGHSMGCAVVTEFAHRFPERLDRAVLVSPAGGLHNQPLLRAVRQLARDGTREPARLLPVAIPDYVRFGVSSTARLFRALTRYPAVDRLLALEVPTLAVIGDRDPLMPPPDRLKEVAGRTENGAVLVVVERAAHAVNFSHPDTLARIVRRFMSDEPVVDEHEAHGGARAFELHRGTLRPWEVDEPR